MPCFRCDRIQTDPVKGTSPWARAVATGEQVLVCPECQKGDWTAGLDRCPSCGSARLRIVLGTVMCRDCGHEFELRAGGAAPGESTEDRATDQSNADPIGNLTGDLDAEFDSGIETDPARLELARLLRGE